MNIMANIDYITTERLEHLEDVERLLKSIALTMASREWDADLTNEVADMVGRVAPHPGGRLDEGRDPGTGAGPVQRYLHEMGEAGFKVYMSDIVDAQSVDDDMLSEWEGEES